MPNGGQTTFPLIDPPGGTAVDSDAPAFAGPALTVGGIAIGFQPERPDNPVFRITAVEGVELLEAKLTISGVSHTANLADQRVQSADPPQFDFGAPRPITRLTFTPADGSAAINIQLGGTWVRPDSVPGVNFGRLSNNEEFPEVVTDRLLVSGVTDITNVRSITFPSNVALRLGDGGVPFFFHQGELRPTGSDVPDFADQVSLSLRQCEPVGGACALEVIAHSDTFGRISAAGNGFAYRITDNGLADVADSARRFTLPSGGSDTFTLPVPPGFTRPQGRPTVATVSLKLATLAFGPSLAATAGQRAALLSDSFQVAQRVQLNEELEVARVFLPLRVRRGGAGVTLDLRGDSNDQPQGGVLASVSVRPTPSTDYLWTEFAFDDTVTVAPGVLWLVLTTPGAEVEWRGGIAATGEATARFSADRGNTWANHDMTASYVFVLGQSEGALSLSVGGQTMQVSLAEPGTPLDLDHDSPLVQGLNAAIAAAAPLPGHTLPGNLAIGLTNPGGDPVHVVLTRFDVAYSQTR